MEVEEAMENLAEKMKETDQRMDCLALQVGNIEQEIFSEETGAQIEVNSLLRSVSEVTSNYQNLRKELVEVQDLQKQLSTSLQFQLRVMQSKFDRLKEKIGSTTVALTSTTNSRACSTSGSTN